MRDPDDRDEHDGHTFNVEQRPGDTSDADTPERPTPDRPVTDAEQARDDAQRRDTPAAEGEVETR